MKRSFRCFAVWGLHLISHWMPQNGAVFGRQLQIHPVGLVVTRSNVTDVILNFCGILHGVIGVMVALGTFALNAFTTRDLFV